MTLKVETKHNLTSQGLIIYCRKAGIDWSRERHSTKGTWATFTIEIDDEEVALIEELKDKFNAYEN